jgi:hypothetical protein
MDANAHEPQPSNSHNNHALQPTFGKYGNDLFAYVIALERQ